MSGSRKKTLLVVDPALIEACRQTDYEIKLANGTRKPRTGEPSPSGGDGRSAGR